MAGWKTRGIASASGLVYWTGSSVGVCNTTVSGSVYTVTATSGLFSPGNVGATINIAGLNYIGATYVSPTVITLTTTAGTQTGVAFQVKGNVPTAADWDANGLDHRTWGGNVDGGGFNLGNVTIVSAALTNPTITSNVAITVSVKGSKFGQASGTDSAIPITDANILIYSNSSSNWAGIGADTNGRVWIRTGLSGTPNAAFIVDVANTGNAPFIQLGRSAASRVWLNLATFSSNANALSGGLAAGDCYTDGAGAVKVVF